MKIHQVVFMNVRVGLFCEEQCALSRSNSPGTIRRIRKIKLSTILDLPALHSDGYPPETIVAKNFQAMTVPGMANSRMKDFYDMRCAWWS
jgi:hypothetical protein